MARGFIKGALWGACVGLGAVTIVSVADDGPRQQRLAAEKASDDAATPARSEAPQNETAAGLPRPGSSPDTLAGLAPDVDTPAAVPVTGGATALGQGVFSVTDAPQGVAVVNRPAPQVASAPQIGLATPTSEREASISTDPAQPPLPTENLPTSAFDEVDITSAPTAPEAPLQGSDPGVTGSVITEFSDDPVQPAAPEGAPETVEWHDDSQETTQSAGVAQPATEPGEPDDASENSPQVMAAAPVIADAGALQDSSGELNATLTVPSSPASGGGTGLAGTDATSPQDTADDAQATAALEKEIEAIASKPAEAVTSQIADAPQPQAVTSVTLPAANVIARLETEEPSVQIEADAPQLRVLAGIAEPATVDAAQPVDDSAGAVVRADVTSAASPVAPEQSVAADEGVPETVGAIPMPAPAPEALTQVSPDPVATPDQVQFVASETTPGEVRINRLPSLGAASPEPEDTPAETEQPVVEIPQNTEIPPVERHAEPFENPENKPPMAIVLMDQGQDLDAEKIGLPALRSFPYPITFAVDTSLPDAADRIAAYRAEGFEVLATVNLPQGATATDAEVNMSVALGRVTDVVGVLEGVDTGVQTTLESGRQVAKILAASGHGFVTQNVGLNTVQKLAAREGVPSAVVFRDFDAKGQTPTVIRRFLDQAAFKAGQEGGVIMLGRLREDTISALLVWGLQDRATRVALAPVSAVLRTTP